MKRILVILIAMCGVLAQAQVKMGSNPTTVDANAVLEMESTSKGLIIPRLSAAQRNTITNPTNGMLIYNTDESCINMFNSTANKWKSICGDTASGDSEYSPVCGTLAPAGSYATGVQLDPETNYLSLDVNVTTVGDYEIFTSGGGMFFSAAGTFTTTGVQTVTLKGSGYPLIVGVNFIAMQINGQTCSVVINVTNGLSVVTSCGTVGTLTGTLTANTPIDAGTVYQSYTSGPAYTGGSVYGISATPSNGIRISSPTSGNFASSGALIDYVISGTPVNPGTTTLSYAVNGFACSFSVPVVSGTGRASAVACTGTLSGNYYVGQPMGSGNTKVVTLTVSTIGTFYIRTNTVNGVYFSGSGTATAIGPLNITLTASGTPAAVSTDTYTVTVSSSATAFVTCTFNVSPILAPTIPAFNTLTCGTLGMSATGGVNYVKADNAGATDNFGGTIDTTGSIYGKGVSISSDGLTMAVGARMEDSGSGIGFANGSGTPDSGAVYVYTRANTASNWAQQVRLKMANASARDQFGTAVELSNDGNTLVVGARKENGSGTGVNPADNNSSTDAGAAYVFVRSGSTWTQQAYLKASNTGSNDYFGAAVSVSGDGNTVAVGAPREDGSGTNVNPTSNNSATDSGAVYVFSRSGSVWSHQAYIKASNTGGSDYFGNAVSLSQNGNTLAIGALREDGSGTGVNPANNNSASNSGAAYVYTRSGSTWSFQSYLKASNTAANSFFGYNVSISDDGNTLAVGATLEDGSGTGVNPASNKNAVDSGAAYTFTRSGTVWSPEAYIKATNTGAGDNFGNLVLSKDGLSLLVGALYEDSSTNCVNGANNNSASNPGTAYLYNKVGTTWQTGFKFSAPSGMGSVTNLYFNKVAIDGTGKTVGVGAGNEDGASTGINGTYNTRALDAGAVITFTRN